MPASSGLERDLGLYATTAIAVGAMIGSGIFILPGVAFLEVNSAAVVMAFVVAGLLILPAALSAAELATAMPESGGAYVYVNKGMGPLLGTLAGVGNWFMLSFKGALALIGGVPYLLYVFPGITEIDVFGLPPVLTLAVVLGLFFTILNTVSTSSTGKLQFGIVAVLMIVLAGVILGSLPDVLSGAGEGTSDNIFGFTDAGFLAATALVFISYAGVIQVTSVAEEVKDPGEVIPKAIIISLVMVTALYAIITYLAVVIVDIPTLVEDVPIEEGGLNEEGEGALVAILADNTIGFIGVVGVVIAAILALASTANAGILSASRYPLAMARDGLAPSKFGDINDRFGTPAFSVLVTGGIVIALIILFPIDEVAKFGSAFQIIIFMLVNIALIGFREGAMRDYDPDFTSPLYPWMQIFGVIGGLVVITQIGTVPLIGAVAVTLISIIYFHFYVRGDAGRDAAAGQKKEKDIKESTIEETRKAIDENNNYNIMVSTNSGTTEQVSKDMVQIANAVSNSTKSNVSLVNFIEENKRVLGESHEDVKTVEKPTWGNDLIYKQEVRSDNVKKSIVEYATYNDIDFIIHEYSPAGSKGSIFREDIEWILENAPCDVLLVNDNGIDDINDVSVVTSSNYYDPVKLLVANSICMTSDANMRLIQTLSEDATDDEFESAENYHESIRDILSIDVKSEIVRTGNKTSTISNMTQDDDLVLADIGVSRLRTFRRKDLSRLAVECEPTTILVYSEKGWKYDTFYQELVMEYIFRG